MSLSGIVGSLVKGPGAPPANQNNQLTPTPSTTSSGNFLSSIFSDLTGGGKNPHTQTTSTTSSITSTSSLSSTSTSSSSSSITSSTSQSTSSTLSSSSSLSSPSLLTSTTNGQPTIVTTFVNVAPSATNSVSSAAVHSSGNSFLQNKPLSGTIFAIIGLVIVALIVLIVTAYARRRQRERLVRDAALLSFDPNDVENRASVEKFRFSGTYSNHSHSHLNDPVYTQVTAPNAAYLGQDYGSSHSIADPGYTNPGYNNLMPNPYTTYGNPVYQQPRSPSPAYGVARNDSSVAYTGAQSSIQPAAAPDVTTVRGPSPSPMHAVARNDASVAYTEAQPSTQPARAPDVTTIRSPSLRSQSGVHDDDVYGGITSVDRLESHVEHLDIPRTLQVRNR